MFVTKEVAIMTQKLPDAEIWKLMSWINWKKCLKYWMKQHLPALMGELGTMLCLEKCPAQKWVQVLYLPKYQMVLKFGPIRNIHSGLWGRNVERVRTAEGETGMSPGLLVDLFSPPGMSRAERRKLKVICTYSVTLDRMVCSVPCCWSGSFADQEPQEIQGEVHLNQRGWCFAEPRGTKTNAFIGIHIFAFCSPDTYK